MTITSTTIIAYCYSYILQLLLLLHITIGRWSSSPYITQSSLLHCTVQLQSLRMNWGQERPMPACLKLARIPPPHAKHTPPTHPSISNLHSGMHGRLLDIPISLTCVYGQAIDEHWQASLIFGLTGMFQLYTPRTSTPKTKGLSTISKRA